MKTRFCFGIGAVFVLVHLFAADAPAPAAAIVPTGNYSVVALWPKGAPGSEARKDEPEKVLNNRQVNIHNPTLTVYLPPKSSAPVAAVVIAPGGGHGHLAIEHEGYAVAQWLAAHGIAGFALKYRLARDEAAGGKSPYTIEGHALVDVQRAIRLVRARAAEWGIDPARVGVMGFSAGGELAVLAATRPSASQADALDPIDRLSAHPDFAALLYPGGLTRPDLALAKETTPPLFLGAGGDDRLSEPLANFYVACRKASVSAELHIFAGVGHGFGIQEKNQTDVRTWPDRFRDWLVDQKFPAMPTP